jgi:hypothetical protein
VTAQSAAKQLKMFFDGERRRTARSNVAGYFALTVPGSDLPFRGTLKSEKERHRLSRRPLSIQIQLEILVHSWGQLQEFFRCMSCLAIENRSPGSNVRNRFASTREPAPKSQPYGAAQTSALPVYVHSPGKKEPQARQHSEI